MIELPIVTDVILFFRARWHGMFGHTTLSFDRKRGRFWVCDGCESIVSDFSQTMAEEFQAKINTLKAERDHYKHHNAAAQRVAIKERAEKKALNKKLDLEHRSLEASRREIVALKKRINELVTRLESEQREGRIL